LDINIGANDFLNLAIFDQNEASPDETVNVTDQRFTSRFELSDLDSSSESDEEDEFESSSSSEDQQSEEEEGI
jgi:hypothetical protein